LLWLQIHIMHKKKRKKKKKVKRNPNDINWKFKRISIFSFLLICFTNISKAQFPKTRIVAVIAITHYPKKRKNCKNKITQMIKIETSFLLLCFPTFSLPWSHGSFIFAGFRGRWLLFILLFYNNAVYLKQRNTRINRISSGIGQSLPHTIS
jgi:hypothetical protein